MFAAFALAKACYFVRSQANVVNIFADLSATILELILPGPNANNF